MTKGSLQSGGYRTRGSGQEWNVIGLLIDYKAGTPKTFQMEQGLDFGTGVRTFGFSGELSRKSIDTANWTELPHRALANLPDLPPMSVEEEHGSGKKRYFRQMNPEAVQGFLQQYGTCLTIPDETDTDLHFRGGELVLEDTRSTLRKAWQGDTQALDRIGKDALANAALDAPVFSDLQTSAGVRLTTRSLWRLICLLFMNDYAAARIGTCLNPSCPAPYFIKRRRTQKVCDRPVCLAWGQKKYAENWWNEQGRPRRAERRRLSRKGKRP